MASDPKNQALLDQLLECARSGQIAAIEETWIENIAALPPQGAFYKEWAKVMRKAGANDKVEDLIVLVLDDRLEARKFKTALRIILSVLPLYPQSEALRPALAATLRSVYAGEEMLEDLLGLTGLPGTAPLLEAYQAFQEWLKLTPGKVYQHYDWGEGLVQELDIVSSKVTLLFRGENTKVMTVDGVRKYLKYIEPGHFLALRTRDPVSLLKQAETEPAEVVKLALSSAPERRLKQGELKALITGLLSADQWSGWWARAREALKLDPFVDFDASGGAHGLIQLRDRPRTFEQEVEERFFADDAGTALKAELIRQLSRRSSEITLPVALGCKMADRLNADWIAAASQGPAIRLEIVYMLQDLAAALPAAGLDAPSARPILDTIVDYRVLFEVDNSDYGVRALIELLERDGEAGCLQAAALIPHAPVKLAQALWAALDQENHLDMAITALQQLFARPMANPETFAWAARATLDGSWGHLAEYFPVAKFVPEVMEQMEDWQRLAADEARGSERGAVARTLLSRMRTALAADKFEAISQAVATLSREELTRFRHKLQVHSALVSSFKSQAERAIGIARRDLDEPQQQKAREEETHLCTARSQEEKIAELRQITSIRIPKNAKVIEAARMEGDLSENAGYQYAKEEQKMLMQAKVSLSEQLSRARVVVAREVDPSRIGFGTSFVARNERTGEDEHFTILGRWEANPERHILSLQAPLAQQFLGKTPGDAVLIEHPGGGSTPYQVLEIRNALADEEWSAEAAKPPVEAQ